MTNEQETKMTDNEITSAVDAAFEACRRVEEARARVVVARRSAIEARTEVTVARREVRRARGLAS